MYWLLVPVSGAWPVSGPSLVELVADRVKAPLWRCQDGLLWLRRMPISRHLGVSGVSAPVGPLTNSWPTLNFLPLNRHRCR
jgi:hypothetical protein